VFRATLEKGNRAQLFLSIKGEKYALGTLTKDKEYTKLDIEIFEGTDDVSEVSIVGDGTVALIGSYSPALFNDDDEDDFGSLSDFDDEDEEEPEEQTIKSLTKGQQNVAKGKQSPPTKGQNKQAKGQPATGQSPPKGQPPAKGQPAKGQQPAKAQQPAKGQQPAKAQTKQQPKTPATQKKHNYRISLS